jgi:transaldolase/glucose-6-phosphate isomerase
VYGIQDTRGASEGIREIFQSYLSQAKKGDYIAINAYLPRNRLTTARLTKLRIAVQKRTDLATTVGFGPRFLHSTGQLHKGGGKNVLFIQITADPGQDLDIPNEGITFGTLERAQALGDFEALQARGQRVLRLHLTSPGVLQKILDAIGG